MANPNIWAPGTSIDANSSVKSQAFTATASQSVFTLTSFTYEIGTGSLYVYVSGLMQRPGVDFFETASNTFTLSKSVAAGTIVLAVAMVEVSAVLDQTAVVTDYYIAAGGETLLTINNFQYEQGGNHLHVYRNGLHQELNYDYTETSNNSITLTTAADADERFIFVSNLFVTESEDAQLRGDLLSATGSSLVGYKADGAGASTRDVQAKLREVVSVKDFGADPTGVDSTTAIQAAITHAANNDVALYIPAGVYVYTNVTVPATKSLTIVGAGKDVSTLKQAANSSAASITSTGSFYASDVCFDQNWSGAAPAGYDDGQSPTTWGGYFGISITTDGSVDFHNCKFIHPCRSVLVVGASRVDFHNNLSEGEGSPAQTIIACSDCKQVSENNNKLIATRWTKDSGSNTTAGNGISGLFNWNSTNLEICNNTFIGHQLVARGSTGDFTGSISGTTLTVTAVAGDCKLFAGMVFSGVNVAADQYVVRQLTGTTGGAGTYEIGLNNGTVGSGTLSGNMARAVLSDNIIDTPIADTAFYGWKFVSITGNIIRMSGDMGLALDGCQYTTITGNIIDGCRVGGIHISQAYAVTCTGNTVKDCMQASQNVYSYIDVYGRFASTSPTPGAIIVTYAGGAQQSKGVTITGNSVYWENLPPVSDSAGAVASKVVGIWFQDSTNASAQITGTITGNFVQSAYSTIPKAFVSAPTHRFYESNPASATGTPIAGEVFIGSDGNQFKCLSKLGAGNLVFISDLQGTINPSITYTGKLSGATFTSNSLPQLTYIGVVVDKNNDWTTASVSTYIEHYGHKTWTPILGGSGGTSGQVYDASTVGTYSRIGNRVFFECYININTIGIITGNLELQGLPYRVAPWFTPASLNLSYIKTVAFSGMLTANLTPNTKIATFYYSASGGSPVNLTSASINAGTNIVVSGSYITDES